MPHPVDIVLRDIPRSEALERHIGEEARKLEGICDRIRRCRVTVESLRREKPQNAQFAVRLIVTLPGTEVVINREHGCDIHMAVRDVFAAAGLQLEDHMRRLGNVKRNATPDTGG